MSSIRVTVWNEFQHEKMHEAVMKVYPDGIHTVIAGGLKANGFTNVGVATLDEPDHGLTPEALAGTDVLIWWGHMAHGKVQDEIVNRVHRRVLEGMGLVVLHSAHFSKIFKKLMGTACSLRWREAGEHERIWVVDPAHPIAEGFGPYFELPEEEMYGEHFDIPDPDDLIFISWFPGGEVFRSGCTWHRGRGKIFYFRPGHETHPTYYNPDVQKAIANGVRWAAPTNGPTYTYGDGSAIHAKTPLEPLGEKKSA
jgi:trehalose utilization protein